MSPEMTEMMQVWHRRHFGAPVGQGKPCHFPDGMCFLHPGRTKAFHEKKRKQTMKKIASTVLALSMALSSTAAFAGGPVAVVEEGQPEVVAESPRSGWIVPVVVGLIVVCAIACGNDDTTTPPSSGT
jgi:hypothetical protein